MIYWFGGECPVSQDTKVNIILRNGNDGQSIAGKCRWTHFDHSHSPSYDIVFYEEIR